MGGPRFDGSLTPSERTGAENGVWLCQKCAKLVDNDPSAFTAEELRAWKRDAEAEALRNIGRPAMQESRRADIPIKWVDLEYVEAAGIAPTLRAAGYRLYWSRSEKVARRVDLEGWQEVVWDDPKQGFVYLRARDPSCGYMALLQKPMMVR
jgi:hypothetical protein